MSLALAVNEYEEDYNPPELLLVKQSAKLQRLYTTKDIEALPEGKRAELIDGRMYMMASPNRDHQLIVQFFSYWLQNYINSKNGKCIVMPSPFALYVKDDLHNYFEPDIMVICDRDKISMRGVEEAPDLVVEVISKSSATKDVSMKYHKYHEMGVREYWVIDPMRKITTVHNFEKGLVEEFLFEDDAHSFLFEDFHAKVAEALIL